MYKEVTNNMTALLVMSIIAKEDLYGYEIIKRLSEKSENVFEFKDGTLYPVLYKLEQQGFVGSYEKVAENGKKRKYYSLLKKGRKELESQKSKWLTYENAVKRIVEG